MNLTCVSNFNWPSPDVDYFYYEHDLEVRNVFNYTVEPQTPNVQLW